MSAGKDEAGRLPVVELPQPTAVRGVAASAVFAEIACVHIASLSPQIRPNISSADRSFPACQWLVNVDGNYMLDGDVLQCPTNSGRFGVRATSSVSRGFADCMGDHPASGQPISWLITSARRVPAAGHST